MLLSASLASILSYVSLQFSGLPVHVRAIAVDGDKHRELVDTGQRGLKAHITECIEWEASSHVVPAIHGTSFLDLSVVSMSEKFVLTAGCIVAESALNAKRTG